MDNKKKFAEIIDFAIAREREAVKFYQELQNNEVGQHTQLMAYSKLMDYQPTDVIANPQAYMEGGNWRIMYMLKTFQLCDGLLMKNEIWNSSGPFMATCMVKIEGFSE